MQRWVKENSLGLVLLILFALVLFGQSVTGLKQYNQDELEHGGELIGYGQYLTEGQFIEATFENWESEFLQMAAYILLTIHLRQKGTAESK